MGETMSRLAAFALRFTGSFLLSLALLGCQTPSDNVGSGQLILPSGMTAYVQEYLDEHNPAAFAVSQDGRCGRYRYCPTPVGLCLQEDTRYFAVKACESLCKRTCKVLLDERRVVWNGTVVGLPGEVRRPQDKAVAPLVPLSGKKNRPKPITSRNTPVLAGEGLPVPGGKAVRRPTGRQIPRLPAMPGDGHCPARDLPCGAGTLWQYAYVRSDVPKGLRRRQIRGHLRRMGRLRRQRWMQRLQAQ